MLNSLLLGMRGGKQTKQHQTVFDHSATIDRKQKPHKNDCD